MDEAWRDLRVGDRVRIVRLPGQTIPGYYLHEETRQLYEHLIAEGTVLTVYEIDGDGLPWIEYPFKDEEGETGYHFLAINEDSWELVAKNNEQPGSPAAGEEQTP
jgi:hypothetical protein